MVPSDRNQDVFAGAALFRSRGLGCKVQPPSFAHLQDLLCPDHMLADVTTILGSLDIVLGDVDR